MAGRIPGHNFTRYNFDDDGVLPDPKKLFNLSIHRTSLHIVPKFESLVIGERGFVFSWLKISIKVSFGYKEKIEPIDSDDLLTPQQIYERLVEKRKETVHKWYEEIIEGINNQVNNCERFCEKQYNDKLNVLPSIAHKLRQQNFGVKIYEEGTTRKVIVIFW